MSEIKLYGLTEIQKITGVSKTTLYRCIDDGRLIAVKMGRRFVVTEENLKAFIDRGTLPARAAGKAKPGKKAQAKTPRKMQERQ